MDQEKLLAFCKQWLLNWSKGDLNDLLAMYTPNAFYSDPAYPDGITDQIKLKTYFQKLFAANPNWNWELVRLFNIDKGFTVKWKATIPIGAEKIVILGMDLVEFEKDKICRNEVFFDRTRWLAALQKKIK